MSETEEDMEEINLARKMKDEYCDKSGKETNPANAALIMHKIGVIYRNKSLNKLSLIKSAGLFNAAIVRNPSTAYQMKCDLRELCQHVLKQASAVNQNADLIEKAKQVKTLINKLRNEVEMFLNSKVASIPANATGELLKQLNFKKISKIRQLNKMIAKSYKSTMADLSQFCENVMGKPPCEYAVAGMGSLAREEITPYSDFEHIILLFDDENYASSLEYFRWFSVIFHIIILNLQETILPSLNICSLNGKDSTLGDWYYDAHTHRGISFDGMMPHACKFSLGRTKPTKKKNFTTELIKPVSQMLEYLSSEADEENGYHLADILTKTCFVFGNENIFKEFGNGVRNFRNNRTENDTIENVQQQVKEDLNSFATRFRLTNLKSQDSINIKQLVYRSTGLFITALAHLYKVSANSSFDMIDEMANKNKITQKTADKLRFAIAIACEMRLRVYTKHKCQNDNAVGLKHNGIEKFLDIVGVPSTINFFQIAYCLQCEVAKQLNFSKLYFYSDPQLVNITIGLAFGMTNLTSISKNPQKRFWDSTKFDFDACIEQLESQITLETCASEKSECFSSSNAEQIKSIAVYLSSTEVYDEAVDFFKQLLEVYRNKSTNKNYDCDVAWTNQQIGMNLGKLFLSADALNYFKRALEFYENASPNDYKKSDKALTLNGIGVCYTYSHDYDLALSYLNQSLDIKQEITLNAVSDKTIAISHVNIGYCYVNLEKHNVALIHLNKAKEIQLNATLDPEKDNLLAVVHCNIGLAQNGLQQYDSAWSSFKQSLDIFQFISLDERIDRRVADIYNYLGETLLETKQYAEALKYIKKAMKIYKESSTKKKKDTRHARVFYNNGVCLMKMQDHKNGLKYLEQSLTIFKEYTENTYISGKIAQICEKKNNASKRLNNCMVSPFCDKFTSHFCHFGSILSLISVQHICALVAINVNL